MEKQDLKNLLENIYYLLAEEAPQPTAEEPRGTVTPTVPPGSEAYYKTQWWDYDSWMANHPNMTPYGPGPFNGTWEHPGMGEGPFTLYALPPDTWPQWKYPFGHDGPPLPDGDYPGSGRNGQWVFGGAPNFGYYYVYPEGKDGLHQVFQWNGEVHGGFEQLPSWGTPS